MSTRTQPRPVHHPLFARVYARVGHLMDAEIGDHRRRLLTGLTGRVLEVGAGNGLNFPHYPATVTEVPAIEPEPYLRRQALAAARQAPVPIRVVAGTAEALPAPDGAVDVVVASLVLCTVTDLQAMPLLARAHVLGVAQWEPWHERQGREERCR